MSYGEKTTYNTHKSPVLIILGIFFSITIIYFLLVQSFNFLCYGFKNFIYILMENCGSYESLSRIIIISKEDAFKAVEKMMQFLHDPQMKKLAHIAVINSHWDNFFSNRTFMHLSDVKNIFIFCLKSSKFLFILSLILIPVSAITKNLYNLYHIWLRTLAFICTLLAAITTVAVINFNTFFVIFHKILFDNDLWLLNPYKDYLINLLPEEFFAKFAICAIIVFLIFCFVFSFFLKTLSRLEAKSYL